MPKVGGEKCEIKKMNTWGKINLDELDTFVYHQFHFVIRISLWCGEGFVGPLQDVLTLVFQVQGVYDLLILYFCDCCRHDTVF